MQKLIQSKWILPFVSGVLTFIAVGHINFILGWICFVPLFVKVINQPAKASFRSGFIFGSAITIFGFYWMIPGAERFTGNSIFYGIGVYIISVAFFAVWCGLVTFCFSFLKMQQKQKMALADNAILAGAVFCGGEALLMLVSAGFPWFDFHAGNALAQNLYAIQPAAYFGVFVITFIVVVVNYLIAGIVADKEWKKLWLPVAVSVCYMLVGFFILLQFEKQVSAEKQFSVAILAENIPPEMKWDDNTGDMLVQRLLNLNREAVKLQPEVALWSESAIPWTYRSDDDLVNEILKITAPAHITHVMGINTEFAANEVFNSAYCLLPDGKVSSRYDKQFLLTLIEKPVGGMVIPFFSSKGFYAKNDTVYNKPLNTGYGKAGVMICNEATVPQAAHNMAVNGAQFLFNLSNDGWFNDTYIVGLHFYNARLRAVETRKDIVINSNNGMSGFVQASGKIVMQKISEEPYTEKVTVQPNNYKSLVIKSPYLFVYTCLIYMGCLWVLRIFNKKQQFSKPA
ncbi:apolipoprotein N-acyltransferase [soil metagenome]